MKKKLRFNKVLGELQAAIGNKVSFQKLVESTLFLIDIFDDEKTDQEIINEGRLSLDQRSLFEIWEQNPWAIYLEESLDTELSEDAEYQVRTLLGF